MCAEFYGSEEGAAGARQVDPVPSATRPAATLQEPVRRPDHLLAPLIPPWGHLAHNGAHPAIGSPGQVLKLLDRARCLCHQQQHLDLQQPGGALLVGVAPVAQQPRHTL